MIGKREFESLARRVKEIERSQADKPSYSYMSDILSAVQRLTARVSAIEDSLKPKCVTCDQPLLGSENVG